MHKTTTSIPLRPGSDWLFLWFTLWKTLIAGASTPQETPFDPKEFQGSLGVHIDVNQGVTILQMLLHHAEGEER